MADVGIRAEWQRLSPAIRHMFLAEAERRGWPGNRGGQHVFALVKGRGLCNSKGEVPLHYAMAGCLPAPDVGYLAPSKKIYFEAERVFW